MELLILGIAIGLLLGVILAIVTQPLWLRRGGRVTYPPRPRGPEKRGSQPVMPPKRYPPQLNETLESRRRQSRGDP